MGDKDKSGRGSAYKSPDFAKKGINDIKSILGVKRKELESRQSDKTEEMAVNEFDAKIDAINKQRM